MKQETVSEAAKIEMLGSGPLSKGWKWAPIVGEETVELLDHLALSDESRQRLRDEAIDVLARCVPPANREGKETGLTVGYVQSGKTMSFTTVAALARDNGYRMVIVIAGTSKPLLRQSTERLVKDLRIGTGNRSWQLFESQLLSKSSVANTREQLRAALDTWNSGAELPFAWMRRTILIVVMKHYGHLDRVRELLTGIDLRAVPSLIIDDEADQASLNAAVRKKDETKTYSRIRRLREQLPHHTFLQYTATPQAPLLLNIIDALSPRFAEILTPGPEYVGGKDFFIGEGHRLTRVIPDDELPGVAPLECAPESLLRAMRLFFVGATAGFIREKGKGNRSMLVHPSQERTGHSEYYSWVMSVRGEWSTLLNSATAYAEDRADLLSEFESAYDDVAETTDDLPSREELFKVLPWVVANTVVLEVNSRAGQTPTVNWTSNYSHILVGGQAMDRGFTVEGLTVTYMPRSLGVGNADTIQQRARFFGYKRRYLGYCRVFLENASLEAYRKYVVHEEDMRRRLIEHRATNRPLSEWKRRFYLDKGLKPTRSSVLELDYFRAGSIGKDWFTPRMPHFESEGESSAVEENKRTFARFHELMDGNWHADMGAEDRTEFQRHLVARTGLRTIFERCLLPLRFTDKGDSQEFTVVQILLAELLDKNPYHECLVYLMSRGRPRKRTLDENGCIKALFQGAAPSEPKSEVGRIYPGDRRLYAPDVPTIQLHVLDVLSEGPDAEGDSGRASLIAAGVPTVAVRMPAEMTPDLLVQPQPLQGSTGA